MIDFPTQSRESALFITLDSCRFDTFEAASAPRLKSVGPLHRAQAPSHYTYGSHSAMFVGFTPGLADVQQPFLNPKFGKLFKLVGPGFSAKGNEGYELQGRNIVDGFNNLGFVTLGTAAMAWFDPSTPTGLHLSDSFDQFFFAGPHYLRRQLEWLSRQLTSVASSSQKHTFTFINVGETHVPYYFEGAPWEASDNPCLPFQSRDRRSECSLRQRMCCEYVDGMIGPLLDAFKDSTILICGDHGDCWGEDGLWEHGISHPATLTVPLIAQVRGRAVIRDSFGDPRPKSKDPSTWLSISSFVRKRIGIR